MILRTIQFEIPAGGIKYVLGVLGKNMCGGWKKNMQGVFQKAVHKKICEVVGKKNIICGEG